MIHDCTWEGVERDEVGQLAWIPIPSNPDPILYVLAAGRGTFGFTNSARREIYICTVLTELKRVPLGSQEWAEARETFWVGTDCFTETATYVNIIITSRSIFIANRFLLYIHV